MLTLLGSLPAIKKEVAGSGRPSPYPGDPGPFIDLIPRLFAEFQELVDRHEAALACCDRIEATLLAQMDYPRVPLPPDWDGSHRYAGDTGTIARVISLGRHRRRLQRVLQRRQRRWDEAADQAGLTTAQEGEAALDRAVLDGADGLLATP
ncbi:hypothetical protein, partial [Methylobacterium sp. WL116]|uniref:hypothetical protein n=1 Tax=Methylobacterium sp. WL116 TaxID=2603889 RepID=UPI00164FA66D